MSDGQQYEVIAAGVSYFEVQVVRDASGKPRKHPDGKTNLTVDVRREARMGDKINLSDVEAQRLLALEAIQEPGSAPLPGSQGATSTPFSAPVRDDEGTIRFHPEPHGDPRKPGEAAAFDAPVPPTGDAPVVVDEDDEDDDIEDDDVELDLDDDDEDDESESDEDDESESDEDDEDEDDEDDEDDEFVPEELTIEDASVEELSEWIVRENVTVGKLVETANNDPLLAQRLIDAEELAKGDSARVTAIMQLEAIKAGQ